MMVFNVITYTGKFIDWFETREEAEAYINGNDDLKVFVSYLE